MRWMLRDVASRLRLVMLQDKVNGHESHVNYVRWRALATQSLMAHGGCA